MSLELAYLKGIKDQYGYFGNWVPERTIKLGDYGRLRKNYKFVYIGNVKDLKPPR
jgi:hypothetical protein